MYVYVYIYILHIYIYTYIYIYICVYRERYVYIDNSCNHTHWHATLNVVEFTLEYRANRANRSEHKRACIRKSGLSGSLGELKWRIEKGGGGQNFRKRNAG